MAFSTFSGCESSDEEILHLISINTIEGKWKITDVKFEVYQDGQKKFGYEEQLDDTISFYGGRASIEGDSHDYSYSIETKADGKEYITLVKNGKASVFELAELTFEDMRWERDEMTTDFNGLPQREVESSVFKKIED
ncbi:hypothetical protein ACFSKU_02035 [Pontibacter silvestris]|uniref:Lipocalin-like domain-containing protein n=1 Tax=Pontibacter silvestris TaxID=2305183 RepID=A0ABW4WSB0_9BACT|nr:hypothetical protein [Pontibacter silvestris]MCC9137813.1 hypothetical protein [Pontibacter silvestris]